MAEKKKAPRRAKQEGALYQRKNGMWIGRVELPPDPVTGERRRKEVSGMKQEAVVLKMNKLKSTLAQYGDLPTKGITVRDWMEHWITHVNQSRPRTRAGYRSKISQYILPAIGKITLEQLTAADVRKVETYIVRTKKLSSTSALQAYQILAKALKDAEREGKVFRNVARLIDPPRKAVPKLNILSTDEAITVIGHVAEQRLGSRYAAALLTGARQGELLGLELDRVDFDQDEIDLSWQLQRVAWRHGCAVTGKYKDSAGREHPTYECGHKRGTDCPRRVLDAPADWEHRHLEGGLYLSRPKSKAGWRVIPLVEPLREILLRRADAAADEPNPFGLMWTADPKQSRGGAASVRVTLPLDGSPIDPSRDNSAWHTVLEDAGVTDVRLHDARHTAVTLLFDLGIPETVIQDIVGQSTVASTRGYRHKNKTLTREALRALGAALSKQLAIEPAAGQER